MLDEDKMHLNYIISYYYINHKTLVHYVYNMLLESM